MKSEYNQNSAKQIPDFVRKILSMMEAYPNILGFSDDGSQFVIHNREYFTNVVLKENFRHRNWRSFIRQLNMYNFRKINRGMGKQIFVNPLFQKGNESNFHKIRRKINIREEEQKYQKVLEHEVLALVSSQYTRVPSFTKFMKSIFLFKNFNENAIHGIKHSIDSLGQKKKCKQTKPFIQEMKESFLMIDEASQKFLHTVEIFEKNTQINSKLSSSLAFDSTEPIFPLTRNIFIPASRCSSSPKSSLELTNIKNHYSDQRIIKSCNDLGVTANCSFSCVGNIFG